MPDESLLAIDRALAEVPGRRLRLGRVRRAEPKPKDDPATGGDEDRIPARSWPWMELFLATQFLGGALLFVPGAQVFRIVVRVAPYAASIALLAFYMLRPSPGRIPRASGLLISALLLLGVNLLHPTSQVNAGIAQCVFQCCIAAPMFWAYRAVRSSETLHRVFLLIFLMNVFSAGLGVLQVYYPDQFMPPNFSAALDQDYLNSLKFVTTDGRVIFRPPGLSDQPGGAALAGGLTMLLGLILMFDTTSHLRRAAYVAAAGVGLGVIYLTQARAVLLVTIGGALVLAALMARQRRIGQAIWVVAGGTVLVVASFYWASSIGGDAVRTRFTGLTQDGIMQTYQENRGHYITATVGDLLDQLPLGAGVGRWGMMNTYFGDSSEPLYVEPQITGWLLDGGIPMWFLYGGALLMSLVLVLRLTSVKDLSIASGAAAVAALLVFIAGLGMAGPVFNTQMGILFWTLVSAMHGAQQGELAAGATSPARNSKSYGAAVSRVGLA